MPSLRSTSGRALLLAMRGTVLAAALLVSGAILVASVGNPGAKASREVEGDAPKAVSVADGRTVQLDEDGQVKGGISAESPIAVPYQDLVRAYGTVLPLDKLTLLYNASLTNAAQLRAAEAKASASRAANERAQNLLKVFATAKAQAEAAEATYAIDTIGIESSKAQVEVLTNTAIQDWGPVLGEAVVSRAKLATDLVRRKTSLVQLSLQPGAVIVPPARLSFSLGAAAPVEGRLISEATQTDPKIQSIGYFYAVPTAPGLLPGTSVLAYLPKGDAQPGLGIPSSAVVWQAGKPWMYVRMAPDRFERRLIDEAAAPTRDGGYVVPAKSLPQDKPVVVAGAQLLLSQEMRAQIPTDEDDN